MQLFLKQMLYLFNNLQRSFSTFSHLLSSLKYSEATYRNVGKVCVCVYGPLTIMKFNECLLTAANGLLANTWEKKVKSYFSRWATVNVPMLLLRSFPFPCPACLWQAWETQYGCDSEQFCSFYIPFKANMRKNRCYFQRKITFQWCDVEDLQKFLRKLCCKSITENFVGGIIPLLESL